MPDRIAREVAQPVEPVAADELVASALRKVLAAGVVGLPAVEADGSYAGVFGARELLTAVFPRYLEELRGSAMISPLVDDALERHLECAGDPVRDHLDRDHVTVEDGYTDTQLAELFLHRGVQIVPVCADGRPHAVIALEDFVRALSRRLAEDAPANGGRD